MTTRPDYTQIAVGEPEDGYVVSMVGGIPTWEPASGGGTGDVDGPAFSTDNAVVRWHGDTGKLIQNSGVIVDDSNNVDGVLSLVSNQYVGVGLPVVLPSVGQLRLAYTASNSGLWTRRIGGSDIRYIGLDGDGQIGIGDDLQTISVNISASSNILLDVNGTLGCEVGNGHLSMHNGDALRLRDPADNNYISFQAPPLAVDISYTLPTADGTVGQVLSTNGSGQLSWITAGGGGGGDVYGPGASTNNAIVRWNGTAGTLIKNSGVIIDNSNNITGATSVTASSYMAVGSLLPSTGNIRIAETGTMYGRVSGSDRAIIRTANDNSLNFGDNFFGFVNLNSSSVISLNIFGYGGVISMYGQGITFGIGALSSVSLGYAGGTTFSHHTNLFSGSTTVLVACHDTARIALTPFDFS